MQQRKRGRHLVASAVFIWEVMAIMEYSTLDPKAKTVWHLSYGIMTLVVTVLLLVAVIVISRLNILPDYRFWVYLGAVVMFALCLLAVLFFPAIEYRQWRYGFTEDRVEIRHGIFWIKTTVVPMVRIQHITLNRGPLNRRYGLAKLTVHTASGAFHIVGLDDATAETLSESLKTRLYSRMRERGEL